jgi:hypothetical protein
MNEKERVESIRTFLKFNKKTFSEVLGYTYSQHYTKYLGGTISLSVKAIKSLVEYDKRFNINWILTGEGEMLLNNESSSNSKNIYGDGNNTQVGHNNELNSNSNNNSNVTEIELLKKENKSLNKEIKSLNRVIESKDSQLKDKERLISILEKNQK